MSKKLTRGCVVFMKASSGLTGYGNGQCVSSICEQLGTISLFGHNQNYSISDIDRIAEYSLQEETDRLKEFARRVIQQECWSIFPQDGGDIQEWAEKLGMIIPHTATEEDVDDECDYGVGDTIFKFSETLKENKP